MRATRKKFLALILILSILRPGVLHAALNELTPATGIPAGLNTVNPGAEIQIYTVQLQDGDAGNPNYNLGWAPAAGTGITLTISDLTALTGLIPGDLASLNLYRSADAVLDAGDGAALVAQIPVVVAPGTTLIDVGGVPAVSRDITETPGSIYFIVSAVISLAATPGHSFKLGAAANHIQYRRSGGGPAANLTIGTAIAASDADLVQIVQAGGALAPVPSRSIPVMPPAIYGLLAVFMAGYGIYSLKRRRTRPS